MALEKQQKIALGGLAFFAFLVITMWTAQSNRIINAPFERKENSLDNINPISLGVNELYGLEDDPSSLTKDTDGDGLTDIDELNIYKTSPYIEDTDSDGFLDGEEVKSNNDPNCPAGKDCYGGAVYNEEQLRENANPVQIPQNFDYNIDNINIENAGSDLESALGGRAEAADLRKMLMDAGIDPALLNQINDEMLMQAYSETLKIGTGVE